MKTIISVGKSPDTSAERPASGSDRKPAGSLQIPILAALAAVVAFWAPAYLTILNYLGGGPSARSEALEWSLLAVGACGLASVLYLAWRDTRDPAWRAAHGLPRRPR